jgi:hypothetical protein
MWTVLLAAIGGVALLLALWVRLTPAPNIVEFGLEQGEKQLWIGAPRQGLILGRGDFLLTVAALFWLMICYAWQASVLPDLDAVGVILSLIGLPFVIAGLYVLPARFFLDARRRKLITYALTNRRAIVNAGLALTSWPLGELAQAALVDHGDGTGSIVFGGGSRAAAGALKMRLARKYEPVSVARDAVDFFRQLFAGARPARFERINDAAHVHGLILDAIAREQGPPHRSRATHA